MIRVLCLFTLALVSSCAIESMPTGGEKDVTPPKILNTTPKNQSTNFNSNTIEIIFDEYIQLKDFSKQFAVSPPLTNKVKHNLKGKKLTLTFNDTLQPNTTYTLSFGNAIQDISEGNAQTNYKYVFSTGDYIDSLKVEGKVYNAFTGVAEEGLLAALYPEYENDSTPYFQKPLYYDITKKGGSFSIQNVKDQNYQLIVFEDQNFDFTLSSRTEKKGFIDSIINPNKDSLITIKVFRETKYFKVYDVELINYGNFELYLSTALDTYEQISLINYSGFTRFIPDENKDTLGVWFNPAGIDTLEIQVLHPTSNKIDTLFIDVSKKKQKKLTVKAEKQTITPSEQFTVIGNYPIASINPDSITFILNNDTLTIVPGWVIDQVEPKVTFNHPIKFNESYKMHFMPGALRDIFGGTNDTTMISVGSKLEKDYAFLILTVNYLSKHPGIIELLNEKGELVERQTINSTKTFNLPHLEPGKYSLRLIEDRNNNKKWDSGDFYKKNQPEKVVHYQNAIELRANWEIEVVFNVD